MTQKTGEGTTVHRGFQCYWRAVQSKCYWRHLLQILGWRVWQSRGLQRRRSRRSVCVLKDYGGTQAEIQVIPKGPVEGLFKNSQNFQGASPPWATRHPFVPITSLISKCYIFWTKRGSILDNWPLEGGVAPSAEYRGTPWETSSWEPHPYLCLNPTCTGCSWKQPQQVGSSPRLISDFAT